MLRTGRLPDADRLSIIAATILLAYTLSRFITLSPVVVSRQLPGLYLVFELNARSLIALLIAGLTASGADYLLRDHPALEEKRTFEHWLLPALTAWVIGVPLYQLPLGAQWLVSVAVGGALLMLVLVAEYIVVDPDDPRQPVASAGLTALSYALFLLLVIALRLPGLRLLQILPAVILATILISLRTLHLRLHGRWLYLPTLAITLIIAQITAGLHYLPIPPIPFGLTILGPAYALPSLVGTLSEGQPFRQAIIEPAVVLAIVWGIAIWIS